MSKEDDTKRFVYEISITEDGFDFATSSIEAALISIEAEKQQLEELISFADDIRPEGDKLDYVLAASSGFLCGMIDALLVGKPGESSAEDVIEKWAEKIKKELADRDMREESDTTSDDASMEAESNVPTSRCSNTAGRKSILMELYYSILDQFVNRSHKEPDGKLIIVEEKDGKIKFYAGNNDFAKVFCGICNWIVDLIYDDSESFDEYKSGIPIPFLKWINGMREIKNKASIYLPEINKALREFVLYIYEQDEETRFQTIQVMPVILNTKLVQLLYAMRRHANYLGTSDGEDFSISDILEDLNRNSNPTVERMIYVAHSTFCMVDVSDAMTRGFNKDNQRYDGKEVYLRLNIPGLVFFTVLMFNEIRRDYVIMSAYFAIREMEIVNNYLEGLILLSELYNDKNLVNFVEDFEKSDMYVQAFEKSVELAKLRQVPAEEILTTKSDIDSFFERRKDNGQ